MKILIAAAVALTAIATTPVNAQTAPVIKVFYGDLDLHSTAGMTTLTTRVEHAAHALCNDRDHSIDLASRAASARCFTAAVSGAMMQLPANGPQFASR